MISGIVMIICNVGLMIGSSIKVMTIVVQL